MPTKQPKLTVKEMKLIKAKAQGMTSLEAADAAALMPNALPESRRVEAQRMLRKPHVKTALQQALERHNLTPDSVVQIVAEGMQAIKPNEYTGEILPDHNVRLKSATMAAKFMKLEGTEDKPTTNVWVKGDATFNATKYMED